MCMLTLFSNVNLYISYSILEFCTNFQLLLVMQSTLKYTNRSICWYKLPTPFHNIPSVTIFQSI